MDYTKSMIIGTLSLDKDAPPFKLAPGAIEAIQYRIDNDPEVQASFTELIRAHVIRARERSVCQTFDKPEVEGPRD